jgi:hypothetical protein
MDNLGEAQRKLVSALILRGAPPLMIEHAKKGMFDDYKSPYAAPCIMLVEACRAAGMSDMAKRAMNGEFDGTKADAEAWAASPEGRETMGQFTGKRP